MGTEHLDVFPGSVEPELAVAHGHMDSLFADSEGIDAFRLKPERLKALPSFQAICALTGKETVQVIRAAVERAHWSVREGNRPGSRAYNTKLKGASCNRSCCSSGWCWSSEPAGSGDVWSVPAVRARSPPFVDASIFPADCFQVKLGPC